MCTSGSTTAHRYTGGHTAEPVDAVIDRLNDPAVAAAVLTLVDNAELLGSLAAGLAGFAERHDTSIDGHGADRAMEDPDVRQGMDLLVEIARAIGRRM